YYPTGKRNYVRVISPDDAQGVAAAVLARDLGARRAVVVVDGSPYGLNLASSFVAAGRKSGVRVVATHSFAPDQRTFEPLVRRVASSRPDLVYLAGVECPHCGNLVALLRAVLGV